MRRFHGFQDFTISIHAPVKGATSLRAVCRWLLVNFNPRTREGCDGGNGHYWDAHSLISIHAPVKGAT